MNDILCKVYSNEIISIIKKEKFIPRKLRSREKLKLYHKYYLEDLGIVKIQEVYYINGIEYYTVLSNHNRYSCISYPISNYENNCELMIDYDRIYKKDIINDGNFYSGSEIRYWFIVNNINLNTNAKYNEYLKYLNYNVKDSLIDKNKYTVAYKPNNKKYKCRIYEIKEP